VGNWKRGGTFSRGTARENLKDKHNVFTGKEKQVSIAGASHSQWGMERGEAKDAGQVLGVTGEF
jgi:hypothetical protein